MLWRVHDGGRVELVGACNAEVSPAGVWRASAYVVGDDGRAHPVVCANEAALVDGAYRVVCAAAEAGYVGPCGVDAFHHWLGDDVILHFCELNARFTAGFVGVGLGRGLLPGTRARFAPSSSPELQLWGPDPPRFDATDSEA